MKSENWLIVELGIALLLIDLVSFFFNPIYPKGAEQINGALVSAFTLVIGYKFGRSMPQQATSITPPGSTTDVQTHQTTQTPPDPPKEPTA